MSIFGWLDSDLVEGKGEGDVPQKEVEVVVDSPKKIYKDIEEAVRHLSVQSGQCSTVKDLFSTEIIQTRLKIQGLCEGLIKFYSPSMYGACAREKLWKYVFYDAVARARKFKKDKDWSPLELAFMKAHIENGVSKLYFLILKIQECAELGSKPLISHPSSLDSILNEGTFAIQKSRGMSQDDKLDKDQQKLVETLYMCYINMGDLYRYMKDIYGKSVDGEGDYFLRSQELYTQAYLVSPTSGLSLNQLGNIYSEQNWGVDSAYYLLYSSLAKHAYEGATPNLRQLLDSKMVQFARRPAMPEPTPLELLCNGYVKMIYQMLFENTPMHYETVCKNVLTNFHELLASNDSGLDDQLLYKFGVISIMIVWKLQLNNSPLTSPAVAFAMSIFFSLVTRLGSIIDEHASVESCPEIRSEEEDPKDFDDKASVVSSKGNDAEEDFEDVDVHSQQSECRQGKKPRRKRNCRGPRFRSSSIPSLQSLDSGDDKDMESSDDEDENGAESDSMWSDSEDEESDSDEGSDEEIAPRDKTSPAHAAGGVEAPVDAAANGQKAFSSSSSNEKYSGMSSGENSQQSVEGLKQFETDKANEKNGDDAGSTFTGEEERLRDSIQWEDLLSIQSNISPVLVALTPFLRWLQTSPAVKDALAANAEKAFLEKLCKTLTIFCSKNWANCLNEAAKTHDASSSDELEGDWEKIFSKQNDEEESPKLFQFQLPEDRSMLGMPFLSSFTQGLKVTDELTDTTELVIRIGRLLEFGMWIIRSESFSVFYSQEELKFYVPSPEMLKNHMRAAKIRKILAGNGKCGDEQIRRLAQAYKGMKMENNERSRRAKETRGGHRIRNRDCDGKGIRRSRRPLRHADDKPICVVVDLDAVLKYFDIVRRLSSNKNFIVFVPNSVFETLDMLKDSESDTAEIAKDCYYWIEGAINRNHPGIKIQKKSERKRLNTDYPDNDNDLDVWEYYEMLECCNHLINTMFEGNPYDYGHTAFGDHRDRYSVFYLSGNDTLLDTTLKRGFDPIKIARSLPGVFVDCIMEYPPNTVPAKRIRGPRRERERKWKTSGKCKG